MKDWSAAEENRLRELFNAGTTDAETARLLDCTERSVAVKRHKLGLVAYRMNRSGLADPVTAMADDTLTRELRRRGYSVTWPESSR
jgi:hypothetical protein